MNKKYDKSKLKLTKLSDEIFNNIITSSLSDIEYIHLSSNQTLNDKQIRYLFFKNIDNVNINLLRNDNCPSDKIIEFIKLNDKIYNIAIAHNKTLSKRFIKKLLQFDDPDVTMSLAFNGFL